MKAEIVNAEMCSKIDTIIDEWNAADRLARKAFTGWVRLVVRAGIETGAMVQIGQHCESIAADLGFEEPNNIYEFESLGVAAFKAYKRGQYLNVVDSNS